MPTWLLVVIIIIAVLVLIALITMVSPPMRKYRTMRKM